MFFESPHTRAILCMGLLSTCSFALADEALARRVVRLSGMPDAARRQMQALITEAQRKNSDLPSSTWDNAEKEISSLKMEQEMAHLWAETYTTAELTEIEKFLSTPTGHKFLATNQSLMPRLAASAALESIQVLQILQREHPDRFPPDPKKDAQVKQLFEILHKGSVSGGVK